MVYVWVYSLGVAPNANEFLCRLVALVDGKVQIMHADNGSEFEEEFAAACRELGIEYVYSSPRTPKDNVAMERFNCGQPGQCLAFCATICYSN